ncbi:DoxX-like family protein [Pseudomonas sp. NPDC088368]|uniref:DoxX-like family protein n=1 Tax=Pseudomonas sp. NPDC088368 TaxID=3364453 RepID=UPI00382605F3
MSPLRQAHWLGRGGLAFMFAYHGLVPKFMALSPGELVLLRAHGLEGAPWLSHAAGAAELMLAAVLLLVPRLNWPVMLAAFVLLGLLVDVAVMQPSMLVDAFNPVTLNVAGMVLCAVAWVTRFSERIE